MSKLDLADIPLVGSLGDQADLIFKLFEYKQIVERCEQQFQKTFQGNAIEMQEIVVEDEEAIQAIEKEKNDVSFRASTNDVDVLTEESAGAVITEPGKEEKVAVDERILDNFLDLLSNELIPDDELSKLPDDTTKEVFCCFLRTNFQVPDIDETPLGIFLMKKKEAQIEGTNNELVDLSTYELEKMLDFTLKENKILRIQNDVFKRFLKKKDPRFDESYVETMEEHLGSPSEDSTLDVSSAEMINSKVIFPDLDDDYNPDQTYRNVLDVYTRVVEHEIRGVYKQYEMEMNKFATKMKDFDAIKKSLKIHRDKISETRHLLNVMVVKKQKKRISCDTLQFAEFLKAAIKQDQQDWRRLRVLIYEYNKKISTFHKKLKSHDTVRQVDLELYEIKAKQLSAKLNEHNEEFLQLKKIFDAYQRRLFRSHKKLEENRMMITQNYKTYFKKAKDLGVQQACYKMAIQSFLEVLDGIIHLHSTASE